jgi:uncharacterized protein YlzI (FlbEa/FlbD family)
LVYPLISEEMKLFKVDSQKTEKEFLEVPKRLYKNDPVWVCPLDNIIKDRFDPDKNILLKNGQSQRWILKNENDELIGRIAAFYNEEKAFADKVSSGGVGFFECINNTKASGLLFDTAADWLRERGLQAMDAPINFGENDTNWGLLTEGFTHPGFGMPYNFPYYKSLFEDYGFRTYFKQFSYHLDLTKKFPQRFWKIAEWIGKKPDFTFEHFKLNNFDKYIHDLIHVYNTTWAGFKEDYTPLKYEDMYETMRQTKAFLDPHMIWFAYYKNEAISFFIMLPDINQILKKFKGKMNLWNMIRFKYYLSTGSVTRIRAMVAGVVPKFQNSGVESGIFWHMNEKMKYKKQYKEIELSWVGDYNPKMISLYEAVGAVKAKTHHTYRYMLDPKVKFERFMPEKVGTLKEMKNKKSHVN